MCLVDDGIVIGDNCYQPVNGDVRDDLTWDQADEYCREKMLGILTELESEDEKIKVLSARCIIVLNKTFQLESAMSNWYHPQQSTARVDWWLGMTDKEADGEYRWMSSGEELQNENWWRKGEPDSNLDCVSLSGDGGLQAEICSNNNSPDGMITRKPLCKLGSN